MKTFRRILYTLLVIIIIGIVWYAWPRVPIITGYAAKGMCSGVYVAHRSPASISRQDLNFFPIHLARTKVHPQDSSVTATFLGLAKRKAAYRQGLGCTLLADTPEAKIKTQALSLPPRPFDPDTVPWPLGSRLPDTLPAGIDYSTLDSLLMTAIDPPGADPVKKTFAVVIVYNDTLIGEAYAPGITAETPLLGWSMTKSITNALTGLCVKDKKLSVDEPTPVPEWKNDNRRHITLDHLLHMTSGLAWDENYFNVSDATKMLYVFGDMYHYAIGNPAAYPPDSIWYYSSGTANILTGIIRYSFPNDRKYYHYPYQRLFYRTGMLHTTIEADASGTFVGSSYSYATARDWARFGLLYLHNGVFAGDTILPTGWVHYARTPAPHSGDAYGALFWLNLSGDLPDVPKESFFCDGFKGQRVFIIPSKKLVVVRLGWSYKHFDFNRFLAGIISTLPERM